MVKLGASYPSEKQEKQAAFIADLPDRTPHAQNSSQLHSSLQYRVQGSWWKVHAHSESTPTRTVTKSLNSQHSHEIKLGTAH